jgi:2,3-bisphosphoglycerate-dependent phosphoglycerate mutase
VTRLVFIRHGESQVYVDRIVGGLLSCNGLSELGRKQAGALRDRLAATRELDEVDALVASTMPRARETAEIIAPALRGLAVVQDEGLCERHPGEADGMSWDDVFEKYPWEDSDDDPTVALSPGGETWADFHERVGTTVRRLASEHEGRTVAVACHGGVIDAALRDLLGLPMLGGFELSTENTSLTELALVPARERRASRWRLVRYNDAAHLASLT